MIQHPEIDWIEATGYPSWMKETDTQEEPDEDAIYEESRERDYGWE